MSNGAARGLLAMMESFAIAYATTFLVLLAVTYVLPAGLFHWLLFTRRSNATESMRIQKRRARPQDVRREIRDSVIALLFFSLYSLFLYNAFLAGKTAIYSDLSLYPWWWPIFGFVTMTVLHDAYFYAVHRLMHLRPIFRAIHARHHRSLTPTPWSILSFQPLETVPQFCFFVLMIFFLPLHPATLFVYLFFDGLVNAAGHSGHEFSPPELRKHWLFKYLNAVTHHDLHHSRFHYNFGQYFNFWDRTFGTFLDRRAS